MIDPKLAIAHDCVWGDGPLPAKLMIIGECCGKEELLLGRPFVGRCGQLLDKMLKEAKIDRSAAYVTNTVKFACRVGNKNRPPKTSEIKECLPFLHEEIIKCQPKIILMVGNIPSKHLTKFKDFKMSEYIGQTFIGPTGEEIMIPIFHPSYLLQYGAKYNKQAQEVLNQIPDMLKLRLLKRIV